jgi:hypothetical protein
MCDVLTCNACFCPSSCLSLSYYFVTSYSHTVFISSSSSHNTIKFADLSLFVTVVCVESNRQLYVATAFFQRD